MRGLFRVPDSVWVSLYRLRNRLRCDSWACNMLLGLCVFLAVLAVTVPPITVLFVRLVPENKAAQRRAFRFEATSITLMVCVCVRACLSLSHSLSLCVCMCGCVDVGVCSWPSWQ